jgi:hypothetical protein
MVVAWQCRLRWGATALLTLWMVAILCAAWLGYSLRGVPSSAGPRLVDTWG